MNGINTYFPPFDTEESAVDAGQKWEDYVKKYERFVSFQGITDEQRKIDGLLHVAGQAVVSIYDNFDTKKVTSTDSDKKGLKEIVALFTEHFTPKRSTIYERHVFRTLKQSPEESVLNFVTRLRTASKYCKFEKVDDEILSAVLSNGTSLWLTKKALSGNDEPTLASVMKMASTRALADNQAAAMVEPCPDHLEAVNYTRAGQSRSQRPPSQATRTPPSYTSPRNSYSQGKLCGYCGQDSRHETCPAAKATCHGCSKIGHFAKVCKSKKESGAKRPMKSKRSVNFVTEESDEGDDAQETYYEYALNINVVNSKAKSSSNVPTTIVRLCGEDTKFTIDTGSSLNIIDKETYDNLFDKPVLSKPICNAFRFDSNKPINFAGRFKTDMETPHGKVAAVVHVLKYVSTAPRLLSYETASALGLVHVVSSVSGNESKDELRQKYPNLFSEKISCIKDYELELFEDKSIRPTRRQHYRIPYHLQPQVEALLNEREQNGLIEKATGPTTWLSACHVVPKKDPSQIRLVIDARPVNKAIVRHRHPTPTLDDIQTAMNGSKVFSKLDFKEGYRQIKLHPNSRHLTTFSTHKGLFRDTRLSPGLSAGAESFQWIVGDVIKDINNVMNVSDDIMIHGKDQASHDKALHELLSRLESVGFTANLAKCEFNTSSIDFFGVNFSKAGMSPLASRVDAFQKASRPETASELRSMLASSNWSSRFIQNFSSIVAPLRELAKPTERFTWTTEHDRAFKQLKKSFTVNTLAYFNPAWHTEVYSDASPVGLGAILVQVNPNDPSDRVVIAFASRALSSHERKYSQVELEALALIFAVERFHAYVYGKRFKLYSDAKAIVFIYGGKGHKSPARIERWGLRLLPYDFEIVHTQGDGNPADYLSRHPVTKRKSENTDDDADLYVNFIVNNSLPQAITRKEIIHETEKDVSLQLLIKAITASDRKMVKSTKTLRAFDNSFESLSVSSDGLVLRGHQIVVPTSLRQKMVDIAHEGHLGIVKTKQSMRRKVWFPFLDQLVETKVGRCIPCQACTQDNCKRMVPLENRQPLAAVWHTVAGDFFGPLPSGHYLIAMVCETTGYPLVEAVTTTSARAILPICDRMFSEFGSPTVFRSDNGPPFQGKEFKDYCSYMGIKHERSTPYWPRGNAKVERFMKNLGKTVRIAQLEGQPWKQALNAFLRSYREAPHGSTGFSPYRLMFGREMKSRLPSHRPDETPQLLRIALANSSKKTERNRQYADDKLHTGPSTLKPGDQVLVRQTKVNKLTPTYNPSQLTVKARQGSWVMCQDANGKQIERNISFFKPLPFLRPDDTNDDMVPELTDSEEDDFNETSADTTPAKNIKLAVEAAGTRSPKKFKPVTPVNSGHYVKKAAARKSRSEAKSKASSPGQQASSPGQSPKQGLNRPKREVAKVNYKESRTYVKKLEYGGDNKQQPQ